MTSDGPQIEAKRDASGRYSVPVPVPVREPIEWPLIGFLFVSGFGLVSTLIGFMRWLVSG